MQGWPADDTATIGALGRLQALDDAIAFRAARLAVPCAGCAPAGRCDDHASDAQLITACRRQHADTLRRFLGRFDPADVRGVMTGSDGTPPTVLAGAVALHARLRELAASGPFITTRDTGLVVIELDGRQLTERPLTPGTGPA